MLRISAWCSSRIDVQCRSSNHQRTNPQHKTRFYIEDFANPFTKGPVMTKKLAVLMFLTVCLTAAGSIVGQKHLKPWKEWSKKDAEKMLSNSPWSQRQVDMDYVEASTLTRPRDPSIDATLKQNEGMTSHIRFFSARPVRQAF